MKSAQIRSFFWLVFSRIGVNTERYGVSLRIQSKCGEIKTRVTPNTNTFTLVLTPTSSIHLWIAQRYFKVKEILITFYYKNICWTIKEPVAYLTLGHLFSSPRQMHQQSYLKEKTEVYLLQIPKAYLKLICLMTLLRLLPISKISIPNDIHLCRNLFLPSKAFYNWFGKFIYQSSFV